MDSAAIRQRFLDFFAQHGHHVVQSASIVPSGDSTLYFTNAGMVQFKDVFIGAETRDYRRACSSQKCLRVAGKHNDLEEVGRTARHHTFFEMLGNFSFGDYFKRDAIRFAWQFLTDSKWMGLDPTRMVATVFGGEEGIPADDDAASLWQSEAGLPETRIFRLSAKDNFWAMGNEGPCGPCTEIHYHQGDHLPCSHNPCLGVACECDRWLEIWNVVFMQYNRLADGTLQPLAATGVDTGMGLERLVAVKQGKLTNYDTDLLRPIIEFTAALAGVRYGSDPERDVSLRVVADHARATAICIADGVFPEKGGREYVLRRIMRRAIRHGTKLGFDDLFFHKVCLDVVKRLSPAYPELAERAEVISKVVQAEESSFRRTLSRGLSRLNDAIARTKAAGQSALGNEVVGDLYATDGFPIDLTRTIAEEAALTVDEEAARQWVAATHGAAADSKVGDEAIPAVFKALADRLGPTAFLGYEQQQAAGRVLAIVAQGAEVRQAQTRPMDSGAQSTVDVVCDQTPMYGRAGGQLGDVGELSWPGGRMQVLDTLKPGGALIVHRGQICAGTLEVGQAVKITVDDTRRQAIRLNHSATHLLHHALRAVLGEHVAQKGSEVAPDQLRFDFSHFSAMTGDELADVERRVNREIRTNAPSRTDVMAYDEAKGVGAMALFGEKYGDKVRVVRIGTESVELCGGTHVERAGEIGFFKIVAEEALALGVRRIAAVTGERAVAWVQEREQQLAGAAALLRCAPHQVGERLQKLQKQLKDQDRATAELKQKLATGGSQDLLAGVREVNGIKVLAARVDAADPKTLREAGDRLRDRLGSGVLVLGGEHNGKATLLAMVSKDLVAKVHAGHLVGRLAEMLGGKGGGRPDMAQAGGPNLQALEEALAMVPQLVSAASDN